MADSVTVTSKLQWFGTLRARTGIVVDNLLLYATGGIAYANFDRSWAFFEDVSATTTTFTSQKTLFGWTGGVGTEWAWTPNWSIKSEVLYMRFASDNTVVTGVRAGRGDRGPLSSGQPGFGLDHPLRPELPVGRPLGAARFCGRLELFKTAIHFLDLW